MGARFKFPPSAGETEAQRVAVLWPGEGIQSRVCLPTARAFPAPTQHPAPAALKWDGLGAGVGGWWHLPGRKCALWERMCSLLLLLSLAQGRGARMVLAPLAPLFR